MVSYPYKMPSGIAGNLSRPGSPANVIESRLLDAATPPLAFGIPVKLVSNKLQPIQAGDTAASVAGLLVRTYPTTGNGTDGLGVATPNTTIPGDLMKRGYLNVVCNNASVNPPAANGTVYIRVGNASTGKPIGGIEAAADQSAASAAKSGGNTGNGTLTGLSVASKPAVMAGVYQARVVIAGTNAATINLYNPLGDLIDQKQLSGSGATAVFNNDNLSLTITDGSTDFVVGDGFDITVTMNTVPLPSNTYFTGVSDSSGNAEVAYRI